MSGSAPVNNVYEFIYKILTLHKIIITFNNFVSWKFKFTHNKKQTLKKQI